MSAWSASKDGRRAGAGAHATARTLINDLSRKMEQWTGLAWTVIVSNEAGRRRCGSQNEVKKNQARARRRGRSAGYRRGAGADSGTKVSRCAKLTPSRGIRC